MEQIGEIVQQSRQHLQQHQQSPSSLQRTNRTELLVQFCEHYSPDYQREICGNPEECYFGNYPTLSTLRAEYGKNAAMAFIIPQLQNLATYCGSREKLGEKQYTECAFVISTEFHYLKVSEIMLFCHRFKTGRYGRFYGTVDPLIITESLRTFCTERWNAYERHEQAQREQRETESRKNAITYEQYQQMKKEGKI
ncbi:MAG: hypothetical protein J6I31_09135 [Prevotella sp.]|nr:hypothetical protein [Prevotella sp.]